MNKKCNEILNKLEAEGKIKRLKGFEFPKPIELKLRLKDMLEDEVDEKYYLKDEIVDRFVLKDSTLTKNIIGTTKPKNRTIGQRDLVYNPNAIIGTLTSTDYKQPKQILQIGTLDIKGNEQIRRAYGSDGLSPTLSTMQGGNTQPKILDFPCIAASRGRYNSDGTTSQKSEINDTGNTNTITSVQKDNYVLENKFRIRKLTPRECWRLMGFKDDQFEKAAKVCSNSQLYKQAGNSIVVNVLESIFENLRYIFER